MKYYVILLCVVYKIVVPTFPSQHHRKLSNIIVNYGSCLNRSLKLTSSTSTSSRLSK